MTINTRLTRRTALTGVAALPFATSLPQPLLAAGHGDGPQPPIARRFTLGAMTITALLDGSAMRDNPKGLFAKSATDAEFAALSAENFVPTDRAQFYFTPVLVDTGSDLVLIDTGLGKGGIQKALTAAGVTPEAINVVVISHMHPDHIGGLMTDGAPTFPNARYVTGAVEYNFWSGLPAGNRVGDMVARLVTPLADRASFIDDAPKSPPV